MEVRPNLHITVTVTETVWVTGSVTGSVRVTGSDGECEGDGASGCELQISR